MVLLLLLFPQYELFAVLFGTAMAAVVGWRALLVGLGRRAPGMRFLFQATVALWFVGIFVALSWAGEKMPWLIIHITLPATLLAAAGVGGAIERWRQAAGRTGSVWMGSVPAAGRGSPSVRRTISTATPRGPRMQRSAPQAGPRVAR
jgi:predicted membrane-bound mannosyltransferase